ncbi:MAG: protease modulator HflK [Opitutaceae bacterium]|nr:protease modulator HflK [Opitutaceae bacterium]
MPSPDSPSSSRGPVIALAAGLAVAMIAAGLFALRTGLAAFAALAGLAAWAFVAVVATQLPRLRWRLRGIFCVLGPIAAVALPLWFHLRPPAVTAGATTAQLQLAAVALALLAFAFHFLGTFGAHVARATPAAGIAAAVPFARLLAAAHALLLAALLLRLYTRHNALPVVGAALNFATAVLAAEAALRALARLYQPARLRAEGPVFAASVLLPALFGESGPLRSLAATIERTFGVKLADTWLVQLSRALAAPLALLGALGLWASTAVTRVPVESRGVLVRSGAFAPDALPPGLHFHAPWPWGRVVVVPTERVQEVSLGFERDLAGPVLWTEKHFEGEQNLLVGQGEELLTINVPVHYRVRDAVAYLRHAGDARAALEALGYRALLTITTTHTAFGLMATDRVEITAKLRAELQAASDRLGLGLEIVFVGLKDVHPPVAVAPAYQDVISAEEQRSALVDLARTYAVQAGVAAQMSAAQIRLTAETAATERRARAGGEAARFLAPLAAYREQPEVFTTRRRLETLEATLAEVRQLILVPRSARARVNFFQGLEGPSPLSPTPAR